MRLHHGVTFGTREAIYKRRASDVAVETSVIQRHVTARQSFREGGGTMELVGLAQEPHFAGVVQEVDGGTTVRTRPLLPGYASIIEGLQPLVKTGQVLAGVAAEGAMRDRASFVMLHGHTNDARICVAWYTAGLKAHQRFSSTVRHDECEPWKRERSFIGDTE